MEVGERKDRFVDALNATRAAVEEGIVPGGGVALLRASAVLEKLLKQADLNEDMKVGVKIVKKACQEPCFLIAQNAGYEGAVVVEQVLKAGGNQGFNAYEGKMVDMMEAGIIDPVKGWTSAAVCKARPGFKNTQTFQEFMDAQAKRGQPKLW